MLFRYVTRILHIAMAGKTLAGYPRPDKDVFGPTVRSFVHDGNREAYEMFAQTLFRKVDLKMLHAVSHLIEFRDGMIACFLMHLPSFKNTASHHDPILKHFFKCARECDISLLQLDEWGRLVRMRCESQNAASQVDDSASPAVVAALKLSAANIIEMQETSNQRHAELLAKMNGMEIKLDK